MIILLHHGKSDCHGVAHSVNFMVAQKHKHNVFYYFCGWMMKLSWLLFVPWWFDLEPHLKSPLDFVQGLSMNPLITGDWCIAIMHAVHPWNLCYSHTSFFSTTVFTFIQCQSHQETCVSVCHWYFEDLLQHGLKKNIFSNIRPIYPDGPIANKL